jgi:hypothetical protein
MTKSFLISALGLLLALGCGGEEGMSVPPPPPTVDVAGTYALASRFDLTASALAPAPAADAFETIKGLRQHPAATLFGLLDDAGVPLARTLEAALPDILESRLDGFINDYLSHATFQGKPVAGELDKIIAIGSLTLVRFDLLTGLDLVAASEGRTAASHVLEGVRFSDLPGIRTLTIPRLPVPGITDTRPDARIGAPRAGAQALLTLGDHAFGVPIGSYAVVALDLATEQLYGTTLRGALGKLVGCDALASSVAHECVGPLCVGHEADLREICERGLDEVASRVLAKLRERDFKAVHFVSGTADLKATSAAIDRIDAGVWTARIDVGMGERGVAASFAGARR